jgi:hypothetical protein
MSLWANKRNLPFCFTLMFAASACTSAMHPVPASVLASGRTRSFHRALVVTRTGFERMLVDADLRPDSLVGMLADSAGVRFAIPTADVARLESEERDPAPVVGAVVGFIGEVGAGFYRMLGTMLRCTFSRC